MPLPFDALSPAGTSKTMPSSRWISWKTLPAMSLAAWLAGCASQRPVIEDAFVNQLGSKNSSQDVLDALGQPTFIHVTDGGGRALGYVRRCAAAPSGQACQSAPSSAPWQICEFKFSHDDRYDGVACSWSSNP
jgi:hypothetical protein